MNPYSNASKTFFPQKYPENQQQTTNLPRLPQLGTETSSNQNPFTLPGFHASRTPEQQAFSRSAGSQGLLGDPTKKQRHSQEGFTELRKEAFQPQSVQTQGQLRTGGSLEDQMASNLSKRNLEEMLASYSSGVRMPSPSILTRQENAGYGSNLNLNDYLLLRQLAVNKENLMRETPGSQLPAQYSNDPNLMLANNISLPNLFGNNLNNPLLLELLRRNEEQQRAIAFQQLIHSLNLNQQLYQNLQEKNQRNSPSNVNAPQVRIPPLTQINPVEHHVSPINASMHSLSALTTRKESKESMMSNEGVPDVFNRKNSDQKIQNFGKEILSNALGSNKESTASKTTDYVKSELLEPQTASSLTLKDNLSTSENMAALDKENSTRVDQIKQTYRPIKKKPKQDQRDVSLTGLANKPKDNRRLNKWQMISQGEGMNIEGGSADFNLQAPQASDSSKRDERAERRKAELAQRLGNKATGLEGENIASYLPVVIKPKSRNLGGLGPRKGKKGKHGKNKKGQKEAEQAHLPTGEVCLDKTNLVGILTSYGKSGDDYVMDEETQKTIQTKLGDHYQTRITEYQQDQNGNGNGNHRRYPKLIWEQEMIEPEVLTAYFDKLKTLLNCADINEEKAIKILLKKGLIPEDVIVTVKKNEKFYSNFLGAPNKEIVDKTKKASQASEEVV